MKLRIRKINKPGTSKLNRTIEFESHKHRTFNEHTNKSEMTNDR
jgi:hypothetical protein